MKLLSRLLPYFLLAFIVCACDDDDKLPHEAPEEKVYERLEFPRLSTDPNSILLVRRTQNYGINYAIEYDRQKRTQRWTCWQWYRGNSGTSWNRNNWDYATDNEWAMRNLRTYGWGDPFQPDPDLAPKYRTELEEYNSIPFQRGHICASADRLNSKEANEQTFYLSNIMPQTRALNEGIWSDMEAKVRSWNNDSFRKVLYIVKGGTIDDANIQSRTITGMIVPKYFYMAVLCEDNKGQYKAMAFWVEHTSQNKKGDALGKYVINIRQLEQQTGIDFFCNLPDDIEQRVENAAHSEILSAWGI